MEKIPQHVAIIMDGNSRWAKARKLPPIAGHKKGADALKATVKACAEIGVKYLTVYAFSTENWGRSEEEVGFLMGLLSKTIDNEVEELNKNNVKLRFLGRLQQFSDELQKKMKEAMEKLKNNSGLNLNVMVSYGGRAEIIDAVNLLAAKALKEDVTEKDFEEHLYTTGMPDPDLLIRTANEMRISNFLLWQLAYSEIYVTPVLWPDFDKKALEDAIKEYGNRDRRFGLRDET